MIGGYVSSGDTIRKAGFDTEKGGQFTVNVSKYFGGGRFNVYDRYTDDHGEWFLPFATSVPGLNLGTYNQLNNYNRYATIITPGSAGSGATENVDLADGRGWKGVIAGGSLSYGLADSGTADINAIYLADSWNATVRLRVDAAVREENQDLKFFINGAGAPERLPLRGSLQILTLTRASSPGTAGANFTVESDLAVYARASDGHHFPTFDDVRSQLGQTATQAVLDKPWDVRSEEAGIKFHNASFEADVTAFYDELRGAVYNDVGVPPALVGSNAYGVEFDGRWSSTFGVGIIQ
jgi:hypothetical protein